MGGNASDVVVVANPEDPHGDVVHDQLAVMGSTAVRFNLCDLRHSRITSDLDSVQLEINGDIYDVTPSTSVWWRQIGSVDTSGLNDDEANLARDEGPHLLIGSLCAAQVRFVDDPFAIARAETKLLQLSVAKSLGVKIPSTCVTSAPEVARGFSAHRGVVAKAVSPGFGIAPFVAEVLEPELDLVAALPTLLQERVQCLSDLRVVVIGPETWIWSRRREDATVDWREIDPRGSGFELVSNDELGAVARTLTHALGLSMSIQDWLETDQGPVFLESNAQGSWLFLPESRSLVAPALARHLRG